MRDEVKMNMSRDEVDINDISSRLAHKKVSNIKLKRNRNKLETAIKMAEELVRSGRLRPEGEIEIIRYPERLREYTEHIKENGAYIIDMETTGLDCYKDILVGACLYTPGEKSVYVPFNHTDLEGHRVADQMYEADVKEILLPVITSKEIKTINHNIKFDNKMLIMNWAIRMGWIYWDTQLAGWVLNENERHTLKPMYNKYVAHGKAGDDTFDTLFDDTPCNYLPIDVFGIYGANDGIKTWKLYEFQTKYLTPEHKRADYRKLYKVFMDIEMPLVDVCTDMEIRGVEIREDYAKELSEEFSKEKVEVEKKCDEYVAQFDEYIRDNNLLMRLTKGTAKINYNSPQQMAELFYGVFRLSSVSRKEPRGTGDKIMQKFLNQAKKADTRKSQAFAEFIENYLRYKEITKLVGTYVDKIPAVKDPKTNAVHTTFNQYGARTGRFSSSDKVSKINLQNIPSKEKRIRKIFKAREGYKMVGGDFSQIEPRVLAYVSGDEAMQEAYKEGRDLYAIMGSKVYQMPYEDCREFYPDGTVNPEGKHRRTTMKSVLLGIMYERGAKAIGEQFNKSAKWAQELIDGFYDSFPKIQQYRLKVENMAETYGYVATVAGRKRRLPDMQLEDKDDYRYQEAHRQSLNSIIQGTSADIMKLAMIALYRDPRYKELGMYMIITVHDELICEVPEENIKAGAELLVETMKRVGHSLIDLPMSVDAEVSECWYGENLAERYGL